MILYPVGSLFMLMPEDNSVESINDPPQPFPNAHSLLIDHQDNLWLGPNAYRESETGSWNVLHPDIDFALDVGNFMMFLGWGYPELLLEDSSERIWFSGDNEYPYGANGLAWYDPTTGYGCKTTMAATNIIEDVDGKLWFFDQGTRTLYQTVDSVNPIDLSLTSLCSPDPDTVRLWRVGNTNPDPVDFTWDVVGTDQTGSGTVPGGTEETPGEVIFETVAVDGSPNTVRIFVGGQLQDQQDSSGETCNQLPTANAGADQILTADAQGNALITLDGSASTDSDGTIVSYVRTKNGVEIATSYAHRDG